MYLRCAYLMCLSCAVLISASGCSEEKKRVPVAGIVLIDGEPLTKGSIQFVPENGRPFASKIKEDGSFRLAEMSVEKNSLIYGVAKGKYKIGVSSAEIVNEDQEEMLRHIPARYADFRNSELEVEITEPREDLVIELTWEGAEETEETGEEQSGEEETAEVSETEEPSAQSSEEESGNLETEAPTETE